MLYQNSLLFITVYNLNNSNFYEMIEKSVECIKWKKGAGLEKLKLIKGKPQAPNLQKILI